MLYNIIFFKISLFLYFLSALIFVSYLIKRNNALFAHSKKWLTVAAIAAGFFFIIRYKEAGHLALVTLFELTFFYAWMISVLYLIFIKKDMAPFIQSAVMLIICGILIWNIFMDKNMHPLNPLLDSFWLGIHVPAAILSYSAFALSFAISGYYLIAQKINLPTKNIDNLNTRLVNGGFILLFACILTGSVWAKSAWGQYWSWDPKETWALITLIIYGVIIIARKVFKLSPKWQASFSILGFAAVLFTFFGVSLLLPSHHAYQ